MTWESGLHSDTCRMTYPPVVEVDEVDGVQLRLREDVARLGMTIGYGESVVGQFCRLSASREESDSTGVAASGSALQGLTIGD
ncbi:hypothetical protein GOP47_0018721 [Adiantum capillus-veneris]|uniref:Uncharacterized protein n=1 Tax=Adiantum capillus-veneris TaxID=13818 RepID=A0A9D4Z9W5_ADICA|nr:hypothetical protein GOP47_0018721 [Adiantum capillus-veneris]